MVTAMNANTTTGRDDLFTSIHKGLRLGLFGITVQAGRTDWADPAQVTELGERWDDLLTLLRAHGDHEDQHILRLLDSRDPFAAEPTAEQHRDLDDLLDDLAERFETVLAAPRMASGLDLYRDLARFVAAYLTHMHDEETRVMGRIWACCTDQEIVGARQRFMAGMSPRVQALSIEYTLPALEGPARMALVARLASAPPVVLATVLGIAERVLAPADFAGLKAAAAVPA
jgi:Hemerythrin HHE cation binding domain